MHYRKAAMISLSVAVLVCRFLPIVTRLDIGHHDRVGGKGQIGVVKGQEEISNPRNRLANRITLWGRKSSVNVQSVLWCLEELDLAYSRIDAGFTYGVVKTPAFEEMNPNSKVPVLVDGDCPAIFEAGAILRYLAAQYASAPFWPDAAAARAAVDKWAEWAKINFASYFISEVFWPLVRVPPSQRDYGAITKALTSIEKELAIANTILANQAYLAGDDFSLADIQLGHCLHRYYDIDVVRADLPHLRAYYDRLSGRPGFFYHVMVSYDELRVTKG